MRQREMNEDIISTIPIDFVTNIYLFCYKLKPKRDGNYL